MKKQPVVMPSNWKTMTKQQKDEWYKENPGVMSPRRALVFAAVVIVLFAIIARSVMNIGSEDREPMSKAEFFKLNYHEKDSFLMANAKIEVQSNCKQIIKKQLKDADAEVELPRVIVLIADSGYCRCAGTLAAKNGFGVKMQQHYTVDFLMQGDSVEYTKWDIF